MTMKHSISSPNQVAFSLPEIDDSSHASSMDHSAVMSTYEELHCSGPRTTNTSSMMMMDESTVYENASTDSSEIEEASMPSQKSPVKTMPKAPARELNRESAHGSFPVISLHESQHSIVSGLTQLNQSSHQKQRKQEDNIARLRAELIALKQNVLKEDQDFSKDEIVSVLDRLQAELQTEAPKKPSLFHMNFAIVSEGDSSIAGSEVTEDDFRSGKARRRMRKKSRSRDPVERGRKAPRGSSRSKKKKPEGFPPRLPFNDSKTPTTSNSGRKRSSTGSNSGRTKSSGGSSRRKQRSVVKTHSPNEVLDMSSEDLRRILKGEGKISNKEEHSTSTRSTKSSSRSKGRTSSLSRNSKRYSSSSRDDAEGSKRWSTSSRKSMEKVMEQVVSIDDSEEGSRDYFSGDTGSKRWSSSSRKSIEKVMDLSGGLDDMGGLKKTKSVNTKPRSSSMEPALPSLSKDGLNKVNPKRSSSSSRKFMDFSGGLDDIGGLKKTKLVNPKARSSSMDPALPSSSSHKASEQVSMDFSGGLDDVSGLKRRSAPRRKSAPMTGTDFDAFLLIHEKKEKEKNKASQYVTELNDVQPEPRVRGKFRKRRATRRKSAPMISTGLENEDLTSFILRSYGDDKKDDDAPPPISTITTTKTKKKKSKKPKNRRQSMPDVLSGVSGGQASILEEDVKAFLHRSYLEDDYEIETRNTVGAFSTCNNNKTKKKKKGKKPQNRRQSMPDVFSAASGRQTSVLDEDVKKLLHQSYLEDNDYEIEAPSTNNKTKKDKSNKPKSRRQSMPDIFSGVSHGQTSILNEDARAVLHQSYLDFDYDIEAPSTSTNNTKKNKSNKPKSRRQSMPDVFSGVSHGQASILDEDARAVLHQSYLDFDYEIEAPSTSNNTKKNKSNKPKSQRQSMPDIFSTTEVSPQRDTDSTTSAKKKRSKPAVYVDLSGQLTSFEFSTDGDSSTSSLRKKKRGSKTSTAAYLDLTGQITEVGILADGDSAASSIQKNTNNSIRKPKMPQRCSTPEADLKKPFKLNRTMTFDNIINRYNNKQLPQQETETAEPPGKKDKRSKISRRASLTDFTFVSEHSYVDPDLNEPKKKTKNKESKSSRKERKLSDTLAVDTKSGDSSCLSDKKIDIVPSITRSKIQQAKRRSSKFLSKLADKGSAAASIISPRSRLRRSVTTRGDRTAPYAA